MKNKVVYCLVSVLWYLLSLLPFWVHYLFSDFVYLVIYRLIGYRVKVVRGNLTSSFPEKSEAEIREIERKFYHRLCDYFVEAVKMRTMTEGQMRRHLVFKGTEVVNECVASGQSCAVYLGHFFNWEWVTSLALWLPPIDRELGLGQLYHPLENKIMDRVVLKMRNRMGPVCVPKNDTLRWVIGNKQAGRTTMLGYINDQVPKWENIHHWVTFLNQETPVFTGIERITRQQNQAVIYLDVKCPRRGYYECEFQVITRDPLSMGEMEMTDEFFRRFEQTINHAPQYWLWSHNRWKRTREEFDRRFKVVGGRVVEK